MQVTTDTEAIIDFLTNNYKSTINLSFNNRSFKSIIHNLYKDIIKGYAWADSNFNGLNVSVSKIDIISQIPQPGGFGSRYFSPRVRAHILNNSQYKITYSFVVNSRKINVIFILEDYTPNDVDTYDCYLKKIISWIYIANKYSTTKCGKKLNLYIYMTSIDKTLPESRWDIISEDNVNSGISDICKKNSEILIYRREEWFKVLVHEIFHNYALDYSIMNVPTKLDNIIRKRFNLVSDFIMVETYTEFWARIINLLYCSYDLNSGLKNGDFHHFYDYFKILLYYERGFNIYQATKILHFMGLTYNDIILKNQREKGLQLYKEDTNVFSYYIGVAILMINPIDFVLYCNDNNINILRFKKTEEEIERFYNYFITQSTSRETTKAFSGANHLVSKTPEELKATGRMSLVEVDRCV